MKSEAYSRATFAATPHLRPRPMLWLALWAAAFAAAQTPPPPVRPQRPQKQKPVQLQPGKRLHLASPNNIPEGYVSITARTEMLEGSWRRLRGNAVIETHDQLLKADEVDYNEDTGDAEARGHVYLQNFDGGDELWADRAEYNVDSEEGKFYNVRGTSPVEVPRRPGVLPSSNPYHFEGKWAEKLENKYVLHNGFITNCTMPKPWWTLNGPVFDIIPRDRAILHRGLFRVRKIPIFYTPYFYKSLERLPRRSGFLTPNIGNSSRRGKMIGVGYFWAINRSYDALYQAQYFTQRGIAHHLDLRGKPREHTDFNATIYGINDKGVQIGDQIQKQGGLLAAVQARTDLGRGFYGRADINYLSSLTFRQNFTESYTEAITSEVHSIGFVSKDWSAYGLTFTAQRIENFQSTNPGDTIVIRKLPEVEFSSRDHRLLRNLPIWVSWDSSGGLLRRTQLAFQTRQLLERIDAYPRVMTLLRWKDFSLAPSFAIRETHYGESRVSGQIVGQNLNRGAREFAARLEAPSIAKIYAGKYKHVIETSANYLYVTGLTDSGRVVRFDTTDIFTNTNEVELSLTNRLYAKRNGSVEEILSWEVRQKRYFDPTFGGAVVPGQRNVVFSAIDLTPYAFLDGPRRYSPVVSVLRMSPRPGVGVEWRSDYDPLRGTVVNNSLSANATIGQYYISLGHDTVRDVPLLSPSSNQFTGTWRVGNDTRRGWNAAFNWIYDFKFGIMRTANTQVTYNTDCCGISFQYRRFAFGTRNENQFRVAFAVANIGSFGTLKKQDRIF